MDHSIHWILLLDNTWNSGNHPRIQRVSCSYINWSNIHTSGELLKLVCFWFCKSFIYLSRLTFLLWLCVISTESTVMMHLLQCTNSNSQFRMKQILCPPQRRFNIEFLLLLVIKPYFWNSLGRSWRNSSYNGKIVVKKWNWLFVSHL